VADAMTISRSMIRSVKKSSFAELGMSIRSFWRWADPGFGDAFNWLIANAADLPGAEQIWGSRHKKVFKLSLPGELGGKCVVFKHYRGEKVLRYLFAPSKTAREAANYRTLAKLGLPMAKLLAAGDDRRHFRLESSYLVTEFAAGCLDGRAYMPGGEFRERTAWRREFVLRNMDCIGRTHRVHCFHKAFTPMNLLWKPEEGADGISICWIDVASCRFLLVPERGFRRCLIYDLARFFKYMELPDAEVDEALARYLAANPGCGLAPDALHRMVLANVARVS